MCIIEYAGILLQLKMRGSTPKTLPVKPPSPKFSTSEVQNVPSANGNIYPDETEYIKKKKRKVPSISDEKIGIARMDLMFLIIFPCFFLVFNFIYWFSFLYVFKE